MSPLTFLNEQSFGYRPRAKDSRSNTRARVIGHLFETVHHAIRHAPETREAQLQFQRCAQSPTCWPNKFRSGINRHF